MSPRLLAAVGAVVLAVSRLAAAQEEQPPENGAFRIVPTGYVQLDLRVFPDWPEEPEAGTSALTRPNVEVRRLRAGLEGRWRRWSLELDLDPFDEDEDSFVKDAYVGWRFSRAVRLRAGKFKLPGSPEYLTPARNTDLMERTALAGSIAAGRDVGFRVDGRVGRFDYQAGLFAGDGQGREERAGFTTAGSLRFEPVKHVTVGGYFSESDLQPVDDTEGPNGFNGRAPSSYRFFSRMYVGGRRLRLGVDAEWAPGAWEFVAEGLRTRDERLQQGISAIARRARRKPDRQAEDRQGPGSGCAVRVPRLRRQRAAYRRREHAAASLRRTSPLGARADAGRVVEGGEVGAPARQRRRGAVPRRARGARPATQGSVLQRDCTDPDRVAVAVVTWVGQPRLAGSWPHRRSLIDSPAGSTMRSCFTTPPSTTK